MKRIHFIEIEDESWCPAAIRDGATDYLQFAQIVDLCSGGGGAWRRLLPELAAANQDLRLCLTDKYPNLTAFAAINTEFPRNSTYSGEEIDATQVPENLNGFRTLFTSFHHFRPNDARQILADAVRNKQGIAIFEFTQRRALPILTMLLTPLAVLLVTPFVRPFKLSRLFWTYLIPAIPFAVGFDGVVSCLRTYTTDELKNLSKDLSSDYNWDIGEIPVKGSIDPVTYLIGVPNVGK
jgi:hypothetical protein